MNKPRVIALFVLLVAVVALLSCSKTATTSISQSYRNPGYEKTVFEKLLVIGIAENEDNRKLFEDTFVKALVARGTTAQASWGVLPQSDKLGEEQIRAALEGGSFDGVLMTRLLGVDKKQEYVPGSTYNNPRTTYYGGYGYYGYYGYYGTTYAEVHEPGYFKTNTTFRLETNLYAVRDGGLVWSGQSDTVDPTSLADFIDSMTAAVAHKLHDMGLIP